jgi:hypothetical protein
MKRITDMQILKGLLATYRNQATEATLRAAIARRSAKMIAEVIKQKEKK